MPYGSNPAAATSSSFLFLLGRRLLLCRLRCRFSGGSPRVVGLAGLTHIHYLLARVITKIISTSSLLCQYGWPMVTVSTTPRLGHRSEVFISY